MHLNLTRRIIGNERQKMEKRHFNFNEYVCHHEGLMLFRSGSEDERSKK